MDTIELWSDSIRKISGVKHVKIKGDVERLESIHIVINGVKSPKQIVRDVEAILLAMFDYEVDHKIISVAQLELDEENKLGRIKYEGINVKMDGPYIECEIELSHKEQRFSHLQRGMKTALNRYITVSKAAIGCIEQITQGKYFFDIVDVQVHQNKGIEIINVVLQMMGSRQDDLLVGSAIVKDDSYETVVRATLDAINRRILQ